LSSTYLFSPHDVFFLVISGLILPQLPSLAKPQQVQVFEQIWQRVNDSFFDPKFNGVDWKAMKAKYQPLAAKSKSKQEFSAVINQMLSELKTSHTYYYTQEDQEYDQLLGIFQPRSNTIQQQIKKFFPKSDIEYEGIGILTRDINGKIFIREYQDIIYFTQRRKVAKNFFFPLRLCAFACKN
jgi:carboxyl-terminal processing protease